MRCNCSSLPEIFFLVEGPKEFEKGLKKLDTKNWMRFYECPECEGLWIIDEWDKYTWRVVSRIKNRDEWPATISEQQRKQLLLASRGGTTDQKYIWKDCPNNQVKGVALCIDHLYDAGARK